MVLMGGPQLDEWARDLLRQLVEQHRRTTKLAATFEGGGGAAAQPPTHLITAVDQHGRAQRTLTYCLALARGMWVVKQEWLMAGMGTGGWADAAEHEVRGDQHNAERSEGA